MCKDLCEPASIIDRDNSWTKFKYQILHILAMFRPNISTTRVSDKWKVQLYLTGKFSKIVIASGCPLLKGIDWLPWMTTWPNFKHITQIVWKSFGFRVPFLLSWEFEQSRILTIHCYTSMSSLTCQNRLIYTKLYQQRSFVNKHVHYRNGLTRYSSMKFHWSLKGRRGPDNLRYFQ